MSIKSTLTAISFGLAIGGAQAHDLSFSGRDLLSSGLRSQIDIQLANMNEKTGTCATPDLECAIANSAKNNGIDIKDVGIKLNYQNGGFNSYFTAGPQRGGKVNVGVRYTF